QRDRRARAMRRLRCASGTGGDGAFQLQGHGPADDGEVVLRGLRRCAEEVFRTSAARGERPTFEAMQWDALVAMARVALGERSAPPTGGAATKVIVRVDADALLRGHTEPGETCELAGVGPVPVAAVRRIVERGDAFLAAVLTSAEKVSGVVHFGRRPNALQRTALEWLHPTCA